MCRIGMRSNIKHKSRATVKLTQKGVSYFAVTQEENWLVECLFTSTKTVGLLRIFTQLLSSAKKIHCVSYLLHARTVVNHPGIDPVLSVKWQHNLVFGDKPLRCAAKCARQGISLIFSAFTILRVYVSCVFTYTDKQDIKTYLGDSIYRKRTRTNFCSLF